MYLLSPKQPRHLQFPIESSGQKFRNVLPSYSLKADALLSFAEHQRLQGLVRRWLALDAADYREQLCRARAQAACADAWRHLKAGVVCALLLAAAAVFLVPTLPLSLVALGLALLVFGHYHGQVVQAERALSAYAAAPTSDPAAFSLALEQMFGGRITAHCVKHGLAADPGDLEATVVVVVRQHACFADWGPAAPPLPLFTIE